MNSNDTLHVTWKIQVHTYAESAEISIKLYNVEGFCSRIIPGFYRTEGCISHQHKHNTKTFDPHIYYFGTRHEIIVRVYLVIRRSIFTTFYRKYYVSKECNTEEICVFKLLSETPFLFNSTFAKYHFTLIKFQGLILLFNGTASHTKNLFVPKEVISTFHPW